MKIKKLLSFLLLLININLFAQKGLVGTSNSPYAKLYSLGMDDVKLTDGFWAERFNVCRDVMVPQLWNIYTSDTVCYAFRNFKIAAGLQSGSFQGPSFHDGDFYKTLEAVAAMYASTKDIGLFNKMEEAIRVISLAQREDGYIYTKNIIEQKASGENKLFDDKLSFEAYNLGHLMTAACVHHRATGKNNLLTIAGKAADFLIGFYNSATPEQARNAICPSHYMGLAELYRETKQLKYLKLLEKLIDIRGTVEGTDDNSDRAPFREMQKIVGHAVRANYLMAGVADLYAENGDITLFNTLSKLWNNVMLTKMYVTGGCGALYDGVSVDGTSYNPDTVQKVHQSYGRDYQLPNFSAHNETCANIGNVLWNYRMFLLTKDEKYFNVVELALYNSVLSGVSMNGKNYFYTNPLAHTQNYPYHLRWEGGRVPYISLSNCCPPNTVRTIAEISNYMYSADKDGLYLNMYGANNLNTTLSNGNKISLQQITNYPWDGSVTIWVKSASQNFPLHLRIPGWCKKADIKLNSKVIKSDIPGGQYFALKSINPGDKIELVMNMPAMLIEANPMVEETRNQVAVKRGPVVYCLESTDVPEQNIFNIIIPSSIKFTPQPAHIYGGNIIALSGEAIKISDNKWNNTLYREIDNEMKNVRIKLIPYYSWANREKSDMTVWMPLKR